MSPLRRELDSYLAIRRSLGFQLARQEKLLGQFISYLETAGATTITTEHALAWATLPGGNAGWHASRLSATRRFAAHLRAIDPAAQVPPAGLIRGRSRRATPYLYSCADITALITAAGSLRFPRAATYQTLISLLAVTGMRVGEAIGLDQADFDPGHGLLTVRGSKFGKTRQVPLHPTTVHALGSYLRPQRRQPGTPAVFISAAGTRLCYCCVQSTFQQLTRRAGLQPRSASCRPRIHDLRHTFAVNNQMSRIASDASFGSSREHALPAPQRAVLRYGVPAGPRRGCGDLGFHRRSGSDASMMRLAPCRGVRHRCVC